MLRSLVGSEMCIRDREHRAWAAEAQSAKSHPDRADLDDAQFFAKNIIKKALSFEGYTKK